MKTGILVHGCHLQAEDWEGIVWGKPPFMLGRLPAAVLLAMREQADLMIFGTGASQIAGTKEGEYTLQVLCQRFEELKKFNAFQGIKLQELFKKLHPLMIAEIGSQNTVEEVKTAARIFQIHDIERVFLLSSPTHIMRCHQSAIAVLNSDPALRPLLAQLYTHASETCYAYSSVSDVVIVEPPHRGDRPKTHLHKVLKRVFSLGDKLPAFVDELDKLIDSHQD